MNIQKLYNYMANSHNIFLLASDIDEIIRIVNEMQKDNSTDDILKVNDIVEILNITIYQQWLLGDNDAKRVLGQKYRIGNIFWDNYNQRNLYIIKIETTRQISNTDIEVWFSAYQLKKVV